ncbi:hypothetical protein BT63DRAFT_475014 [Microthyrium microscopicum]|uniref:Uncharacterized protein n=1 Tax=Microthyrium microscopicum TaxID=703497 RepID=A0A6A6UWE7_9PEZI|nr:hypothetical protein BT63DRAFT_475014 [Microthyrium microscopicum]
MKSLSMFLFASTALASAIGMPLEPAKPATLPSIATGPSIASCSSGGKAAVFNATSTGGLDLKPFIFWTSTPATTPPLVMSMVLGAIQGSGGVIRSNLTVPSTSFRGISASAPAGIVNLIEEYGKGFGYLTEMDCVAPTIVGAPARNVVKKPAGGLKWRKLPSRS